MERPRVLLSWSTGKDSAWALHVVRRAGELEVVGLITTLTETFGRVSMHGVRDELLERQMEEVGLPCTRIRIPSPCPDGVYEAAMREALDTARSNGVTAVVFGDLFLADIRAYREARLAEVGMRGIFPLWQQDTATLARQMVDAGLQAVLTCVDPARLPASFAGRRFDPQLLEDLPAGVDPCGERGEFHTFACQGPMFRRPIAVRPGEVVQRDGFVFADLLPAS